MNGAEEKPSASIKKDGNNNERDSKQSARHNNVSSWERRLQDTSIVSRFLEQNAKVKRKALNLSGIPWKLTTKTDTDTPTVYYPDNTDYLQLRRQQNLAWSQQRLCEGIQYAKNNEYEKAADCYKQGLELVPNQVDLLVAYGALQANVDKFESATKLLRVALQHDPTHVNAQKYLAEIQQHITNKHRKSAFGDKAITALQDASLERAFETGNATGKTTIGSQAYPLLPDSNSERHRKKKRRKRRRDESDSEDATYSRRRHKKRKRRKHKQHRKHKRKRRRRQRDDSNGDSDSSPDSHQHRKRSRAIKREDSSFTSDGETQRKKGKRRRRESNDNDSGAASQATVDSLEITRGKSKT